MLLLVWLCEHTTIIKRGEEEVVNRIPRIARWNLAELVNDFDTKFESIWEADSVLVSAHPMKDITAEEKKILGKYTREEKEEEEGMMSDDGEGEEEKHEEDDEDGEKEEGGGGAGAIAESSKAAQEYHEQQIQGYKKSKIDLVSHSCLMSDDDGTSLPYLPSKCLVI